MAATPTEKASADKTHFLKTELCRFFPRCAKGAACPFAHTQTELMERPDLTKTTLCTKWRKGHCPLSSPECKFAHGPWDLRSASAALGSTGTLRRSRRRQAIKDELTGTPSSGKAGGISRQVSSMSEYTTDDDCSTICPVQGERLSYSNDSASEAGSMARQVTWSPGDGRNAALLDSVPGLGGWSRQTSCPTWTDEADSTSLQMPVMIDVGSTKMPALVIINHLTPDLISDAKVAIAKALKDAQPEYYED